MNENKGKSWLNHAICDYGNDMKTITNTIALRRRTKEKSEKGRKYSEREKERETLEEKEEKSIFSIYAFSIIMDTKC